MLAPRDACPADFRGANSGLIDEPECDAASAIATIVRGQNFSRLVSFHPGASPPAPTVMKRALPGDLSRDIRRGRALRSGGRTDDRSGAGAGGLAPGWKETTAPDGRTYYFNDKGETSWEKPVDPSAATSSRAESKPKKGAIVAAVKPVIPGVAGLGKLPQGWRMLTGEDGRSYYYNKKTGETSWDPPPPDAGGDGGGEGEGGGGEGEGGGGDGDGGGGGGPRGAPG